ncbi:hypothetical protein B296_00051032 [Ensete ventricosum]|uniref:Uncharacterized protein n=1 Tax=Ensete ventricosum TaxID=4639 RepID=A0A426YIL1_ENSVE|nr:hypothetical protein B296_00051032 [Ensete ventricosum]
MPKRSTAKKKERKEEIKRVFYFRVRSGFKSLIVRTGPGRCGIPAQERILSSKPFKRVHLDTTWPTKLTVSIGTVHWNFRLRRRDSFAIRPFDGDDGHCDLKVHIANGRDPHGRPGSRRCCKEEGGAGERGVAVGFIVTAGRCSECDLKDIMGFALDTSLVTCSGPGHMLTRLS